MNNKLLSVIAFLAVALFSTNAFSGSFNIGAAGALAKIEASGTETPSLDTSDSSDRSDEVTNDVFIGSLFAEYESDYLGGLTLGFEMIPGSADVSDKVKKRTDTELSVTGTAKHTSLSRAQSAQAELNDHITLYAMQEVGDLYLKVGYVMVDLETTESLATGSKYGNVDLNGVLIGAGTEFEVGNNAIGRLEFSHTAYESLELQSSATRAGVSPNNLIEADLDVTQLKASIGYKF